MFVHLLGAETNPATGDRLWGQRDAMPCNGAYRTPAWEPDEVIVDRYEVSLSPDLLPGEYEIEIGMNELRTLSRVPVRDAAGRPIGDRVVLERVLIQQ